MSDYNIKSIYPNVRKIALRAMQKYFGHANRNANLHIQDYYNTRNTRVNGGKFLHNDIKTEILWPAYNRKIASKILNDWTHFLMEGGEEELEMREQALNYSVENYAKDNENKFLLQCISNVIDQPRFRSDALKTLKQEIKKMSHYNNPKVHDMLDSIKTPGDIESVKIKVRDELIMDRDSEDARFKERAILKERAIIELTSLEKNFLNDNIDYLIDNIAPLYDHASKIVIDEASIFISSDTYESQYEVTSYAKDTDISINTDKLLQKRDLEQTKLKNKNTPS